MQLSLNILILLLLALITYQDFRYRAISWLTIPLLFAAFAADFILTADFRLFMQAFFFNIGFIIFQLFAVTAYFSLKHRAFTNIVSKYIGWGDILFFAVAAAAFSPANFIVFYLSGIIFSLLTALVFRMLKRTLQAEIPLAGVMALLLLLCYSFSHFSYSIDLYNDQLLLAVLMAS